MTRLRYREPVTVEDERWIEANGLLITSGAGM